MAGALIVSLYGSLLALIGLATTAAELYATDGRHAAILAGSAAFALASAIGTIATMRSMGTPSGTEP